MLHAATATGTKVASWPWSGIIVRQVDTTIIPWVAVSIEASGGFDGYQGRLGDVARSVFEERCSRGLRAVLASVKE